MAEAKRRRREYWAGLGAVMVAAALTTFELWPIPRTVDGTFVEALFGDRAIVGLLRMTVVVAALYGIASVPALVVGGRWAKGVGTTGFVADERRREVPAVVERIEGEVAGLRQELALVTRERDDLLSLLDSLSTPD